MQLPQTTVYALRAMAWLAVTPPGQPVPSKELSEATDIPQHYLSKVLRKLVAAGLLHSQKGHGGGFSLALPARQIRVADILSAADFELEPNVCSFGWGKCSDADPCPLHPIWSKFNDALYGWAMTSTLDEVEYDVATGQIGRRAG